MEVRLIDWDAPAAPFFGFGGVGGGYFTGPPDPKAARAICSVARGLGASAKVLLAAYEAAIVESGVHSLPYGDRDSIGLFQQRDSWGTYAQRMDPAWASRQFLVKAIRQNQPWMSRRPARPGRAGLGLPRALRPAPDPGPLADRDLLLSEARRGDPRRLIALGRLRRLRTSPSGPPAPAVPKGDYGPAQPGQRRAGPTSPRRRARRRRPRSRARWPAGRSASSASRASSACGRRRSDVSADATLGDLTLGALGLRRRRGHRDAARARLRPDVRLWRQGRLPGDDPALRAAPVRPLDLLRPRRGSSSTGVARCQRLTCVRRVDRPDEHSAQQRRGDAADGRDGRTSGTASGRSAPGTSGTSTGRRPAPARRRAAARRPGRRRSRPACRCPTTTGRWASARPCAPRGRRARR